MRAVILVDELACRGGRPLLFGYGVGSLFLECASMSQEARPCSETSEILSILFQRPL
jgi:hypothetical protein